MRANYSPSTQKTYCETHKLCEPNPTLLINAAYKYANDHKSEYESDDDDIDIYDHQSDNARLHEFLNSYENDDDDIIMDDAPDIDDISHHQQTDNMSYDILNNKPIYNIFMNHPQYNTKNVRYQRAMSLMIQQEVNCLSQTINNPHKIHIPINTISVPIKDPENCSKIIKINAAADSGSDIDAIGPKQIARYKNKGIIKTDKVGITVGTGNGPIHTKKYVPITVISKIGKKYTTKFWCLESLPTYDFLVGHSTLSRLGWQLVNKYEVYEHKPSNIDHIESELDDLPCSNYPWKGEPELDLSKVRIENNDLKPFLQAQLQEYKDVIAKHEFDSGTFTEIPPFEIKLIEGDHPYKSGFHCKEYWCNTSEKSEVLKQLQGLKLYNYIEECTNPRYVSPIFTRVKKTGDIRIVFDYRRLNEITQKMYHPIPDTRKLFEKFHNKNFITSLDMKGGYWHVPIKEEDRHKTAFVFDNKIWQWKVMPFGPTNAPMYFQQSMQKIFGDLPYITIYLDDISILSETIEQHKKHLKEVFRRLKQHGIKLRLDKCLWGVKHTEYLGFIVDKHGTKCKASYINKIFNVPRPKTKKGLKRFLGLVQFLHHYLPQMQDYVAILSRLTSNKKPNIIQWSETTVKTFNDLKQIVMDADYLIHPDRSKSFHVFTDASKYGIGGMLAQVDEKGVYRAVAYCSKVFTDTQTRWHVSEQETYAAIYCVEKWSDLLRHRKFILHTDHKNLQKLFNTATDFKSGKLFRWAVRLQDYHFECRYVKGKDNTVADYLSRESVLIQTNNYAAIEKFYAANKTRDYLSNHGGVDILKLYTNHLYISILLGSDPHYISNKDPYEILQDEFDINKKGDDNKTSTLSPQTHNFLNISIEDQLKMHKEKFKEKISNNNGGFKDHENDNDKTRCNVFYNSYLNNMNYKIKNNTFYNSYYPDMNYKIPTKNKTNDKIDVLPLNSKPFADQVIGDDDPIDDLRFRLRDLRSPDPYIQPTDHHRHGSLTKNSENVLRRSKRLQNKRKTEYRHQPLLYSRSKPYKGNDLKKRATYKKRQNERKRLQARNMEIINHKPYEHVWNRNLLMPKYYIPILDDYGPMWDESHHVKNNLVRVKQWNDPVCFAIINFLDTGNKSLITDLPKYIQRYILSGRFLLDDHKILCYRHTQKGGNQIKLQMLPSSLISSVLKRTHTKLHNGKNKMLNVIINKMQYWWPKMRDHIKIYCKCCIGCQHIKQGVARRYARGRMKLFVATKPFEQLSVDIVGPLPTSHSKNRYIVSMIDKFSRYCMLVAVKDITALSVVKAIDKWITTFGPPKSILSDNGPQFISSIYKDYMDNHGGIKYKYTTTYHPECNGQIERLHRWVKERLSLISYDGGLDFVSGENDWSDYLDIIQYTYNTTPNKMTTYSPMNIVLGRDDYKLPPYKFDIKNPREYIDYLVKRQAVLHRDANAKQRAYDEMRVKSYNNKKRSKTDYQKFQRVLWNINAKYSGNAKKLGPKWIGPYEIIDIFNEGQSYKIRVIPLPPIERDKFMNKHRHPKRGKSEGGNGKSGEHRNLHPPDEFCVPRNQIKPYYDSWEDQFDGMQSPNKMVLNALTTNDQDNENKYILIFKIYKQQYDMGYTIEI